ncbi:MAG: ribonuclease HII [Chthonomonadaceae bacterium]|nr:ribonuclease HII [Chthonomonadaceae bacterium]
MAAEVEVSFETVAGCDEAGRGPLAGPVVCAAVILPVDSDRILLRDSKTLSPLQRDRSESWVRENCLWALEVVGPERIDKVNILQASLEGMATAIERLPVVPRLALIDGNKVPISTVCECRAVVKGDALHACVSAASILAKCERDRIMQHWHESYPHYGFNRHFGYPTPEHLQALREFGPCPIHRMSFAHVKSQDDCQATLF